MWKIKRCAKGPFDLISVSDLPLYERDFSFQPLIQKVSVLDEIKREREFYRARGLPCPKDILPNAGEIEEEKANADAHAESDYHRTDEQVIAVSRTGFTRLEYLTPSTIHTNP